MPAYDYRCERCGIQFEIRQSFSDPTLTVCPSQSPAVGCEAPGEGPVKKVFSGVGIAFKGEGFYKTDHGSGAKQRRKEKEAASKESSGSDSSSKSDKKEPSGKSDSSNGSSGSSKSDKGSSSSKSTAGTGSS